MLTSMFKNIFEDISLPINNLAFLTIGMSIAGGVVGCQLARHYFKYLNSECQKGLLAGAASVTGAVICGAAGLGFGIFCVSPYKENAPSLVNNTCNLIF